MADSGFKLTGQAEMMAKLRRIAAEMPNKVGAALYMEANLIMTRAKREFVPVNLGILLGTGDVDRYVEEPGGIYVLLHFGGPSAPYALAVHEHPSAFSPPSWEGKPIEGIHSVRTGEPWSLDGRGPKFLERPLMEAAEGLAGRLAKALHL